MTVQELKIKLPTLELALLEEILAISSILTLEKGAQIVAKGGFVPGVPVVLDGLIRVSSHHNDRSLLLYYIKPSESCVMSFSACLKGAPSQVFATAETQTTALLLPLDKINGWLQKYSSLNTLLYSLYDARYLNLLDTVEKIIYHKIDVRLIHYLQEKTAVTGSTTHKMTHQDLANELGTVREVVSRTLKKLEHEEKISQSPQGIILLM